MVTRATTGLTTAEDSVSVLSEGGELFARGGGVRDGIGATDRLGLAATSTGVPGGTVVRNGGGGGVTRRKLGRAAGGGRVGGGTEGRGVAAAAGWLGRKLDGGGGVKPGRDQAICEGGGALERSTGDFGRAESLAVPLSGGCAEPVAADVVGAPWGSCAACSALPSDFTLSSALISGTVALAATGAASCSAEFSPDQTESTDSVLGGTDCALGGPSDFDSSGVIFAAASPSAGDWDPAKDCEDSVET